MGGWRPVRMVFVGATMAFLGVLQAGSWCGLAEEFMPGFQADLPWFPVVVPPVVLVWVAAM